jgi:hypothetical protein
MFLNHCADKTAVFLELIKARWSKLSDMKTLTKLGVLIDLNLFRYTIYDVIVKDSEQASLFNQLENEIPIDIWLAPRPGRNGQISVSKDYKDQFENALNSAQVEYVATITNIKE